MKKLGENLNALTMQKCFDKYFHCLISHTPDQLRIVSGIAANTEKVERDLNFIKAITNTTSNCQPSRAFSNALIRIDSIQQVK